MTIQFELIADGKPSIYQGPLLYKLDSTGKLRTWRMQIDEDGRYRTLAGLAQGKQATSGWTTPVPASCPTQKEQGEFEVRAAYKHQLDREYHETVETVSSPKMIEPMLAKTYDKWPGPGYHQPKLDGIRCIMTAEGMFSRQGQPITAVPHLHAACEPLFTENPNLILDGELYNHELREDFGEISSIVRKKNPTADDLAKAEAIMQYHVYDIISMPHDRFGNRLFCYQALLADLACPWIIPVAAPLCNSQEEADRRYGESVEEGYEGGVYRLDEFYELGRRSKFLLKRKDFMTDEFRVLSVDQGMGNWAGAAKRMALINNQGTPESVFGGGIRGSYAKGVQLLADWENNPDWWSTAVATVRFFGRSPDGVPRFPVVVDFHPTGRKD